MPLRRALPTALLAPIAAAGLSLLPAASAAAAAPSALPAADRAAGLAPAVASVAASDPTTLSDAQARARLAQAGIGVWSSGGCSDRWNPDCTSLDGIRAATIEWTIILKRESGCPLLVTGGTEVGHAGGPDSHASGHRVDLNADPCLAAHVRRHFRPVASDIWYSPAGNRYYDEGSHWDVTFF